MATTRAWRFTAISVSRSVTFAVVSLSNPEEYSSMHRILGSRSRIFAMATLLRSPAREQPFMYHNSPRTWFETDTDVVAGLPIVSG